MASLNLQPEVQHALEVLDDFVSTELALAVESVDESDRALSHLVAHRLRANHHLHLEAVALALGVENNLLQHRLLVQTEAPSQIADAGHEHHVRNQIGSARGELAEQIPAVDATLNVSAASVASSGNNVGVGLLLDPDHFGNELGVVAEVGIHDDHVVASAVVETVDVGSAQTKLALTRLQVDVLGAVKSLKLLGDLEGAVRGAIVDNHNFPVQVATAKRACQLLIAWIQS